MGGVRRDGRVHRPRRIGGPSGNGRTEGVPKETGVLDATSPRGGKGTRGVRVDAAWRRNRRRGGGQHCTKSL